jgi:hypothetical protein
MAMDWLAVYHLHVLLEGEVHESDTILSKFIIQWQLVALFSVPFNCVPSDAIISTHTHAIVSSRSKQPNCKGNIILVFNWDVICEWMEQFRFFPFETIVF